MVILLFHLKEDDFAGAIGYAVARPTYHPVVAVAVVLRLRNVEDLVHVGLRHGQLESVHQTQVQNEPAERQRVYDQAVPPRLQVRHGAGLLANLFRIC